MSRSSQRILAALIGILFVTAGGMKAFDPGAFAFDIRNYRLVPWSMAVALSIYLPWLEILCGLALASRVAYRGALVLTGLMLAAFIGAYGSTRPRGLDVACGCFGHSTHRGYWTLLIGDTLLLAAVVYLMRADLRPLSPVIRKGGSKFPG